MPVSRSRATISIRPYEVHFDCSQTAAVGIALAIAFNVLCSFGSLRLIALAAEAEC